MKIAHIIVHWAHPDIFWKVLPILVFAAVILLYRLYKTKKIVTVLVGVRKVQQALQHYSPFKAILKTLLFATGLFFLAVALMRPQWNEQQEAVVQEGRDVLIALDISRSMLAQDLLPDRLTFAKNKIKQLVHSLRSDRVGLLLFSGATFLQCPLTNDIAAFSMFLNTIDVDTIASGSTAVEKAVKESVEIFKKLPDRKSKLLVIFTDGEDFSSNLSQVKQEAASIGLHIVTVGVGTEQGAPIPLYDRKSEQVGHQLDAQGNVVISRLNEGILYRLAEDTGGIFVPISQDDADIKKIQSFVTTFEKERLDDKFVRQFQEQYHYPLYISFICLALEWLL
jgi:Ca-activated chloride channel family protein